VATSGTYAFNPDVGEIVEEAYERAGLEMRTGYDLRTARRSLNFLMLEWQNRGINLWTVELYSTPIDLIKGTSTYDIDIDTMALLDVMLRTDDTNANKQTDFHLSRISQPSYSNIPNKLSEGQPLQYLYNRVGIQDYNPTTGADQKSTITLWPTPDKTSTYKIYYYRIRRIADTGNDASNTMDVPDRFLPCLVSGLAYHLATKKPEAASRVQLLKAQYEELFKEAADEDRVKVSARFVPDMLNY
tara:strand:+ start:2495 stop:3226 length:732 start_codon:yes stop_codon:yes gene_type:complete